MSLQAPEFTTDSETHLKKVHFNSFYLGFHVFGIPVTVFTFTALCRATVTVTVKKNALVYHQLPETYFSPGHGWKPDCRLKQV